ncbi:hypothetical protein MPSEU_001030200 [Mayamaea pseudoterrestris]|nr:hypothetical protein MPSEU_001030200 [Mayamaea pseudoterrestris]
MHLTVNLPLLRDMNIVDTPGTNALTNHTSRTLNLLPKADCILFVTSADRPFPESERRIIEGIQQYRKSITIVVNKMDIIEASGGDHGYKEKQKLINFVADHASDLLGANPTILAVSARDALAAKLTSPQHEHELAAIWKRSNFKTLETFLRDTLTTETRIKAKLLNPIGVAEGWINECQARLAKENQQLEADRVTLNLLSSQLDRWRMDIQMDMERARKEIQDRLDQEGRRARIVSMRLHKVTDFYRATLIDPLLLAREWKNTQSIAYKHETLEAELQHLIQETADAIALRGRAQGQAVIEFLGQRPSLRNRSLVSSVMTASKFEETRDNLRENMALAMRRLMFDEDIEGEQRLFLESLQFLARISATLFSVAIMSVGSGALQAVDIVAGSSVGAALAVSGAFVLTKRRPALTQNYERKWTERNKKFQEALCRIMEEELDRLERHIKNGVTPYTRHVQADEERLHSLSTECQDLLSESHRLRKLINDVGTK